MSTVQIRASQATYVRHAHPTTTYYTTAKTELRVESGEANTFLYFQLPSDIAGKTVTSAVVTLTAQSSAWTATNTLQRHADPGRSYSRINDSNQPGTLGGSIAVTGAQSGPRWSWDVSVDLADVASGGSYFGFRFTTSDSTRRVFFGPQASAGYPVLTVTYSDLPVAPSGITPSGGVVSTPKPVVTWPTPDDIDQVQIQIDAPGGDFSAPVWDSTPAPSTVGQYDLSTSLYGGCADGATVDMRTRQHGPLGWSDWSLPVTWGYAARPTVNLTNPPSSSADPTPPHTWTVSTTEILWQLLVLDVATSKVLYDSGRVAGSDLSTTPSAGPTVDGQAVTSVLRVWDRSDRLATAGQPTYTEDRQDWTFDLDTALASFSSLQVVQIGDTPQVVLQLQRASGVPDEVLLSQGRRIIARFDFDEHTVTGGWEFPWWECPPNTPTPFTATPIVGGVAGTPLTITAITEVGGVWLVDPATGASFSLANTDQSSEALGEASAVYTPIGGTRVIVRTIGHRGLEGTVDGELYEFGGRTVADQAADFNTLRGLAVSRELRQIKGRTNIAVAVLNMSLVDHADWQLEEQDARKVRWDFYQTDYDDGGLFSEVTF